MHNMMTYRGRRGIAPVIFNMGTRQRQVVSLTPQLPYRRDKTPIAPLIRRLDGPKEQTGHLGKEKKLCFWRDLNSRLCIQAINILQHFVEIPTFWYSFQVLAFKLTGEKLNIFTCNHNTFTVLKRMDHFSFSNLY